MRIRSILGMNSRILHPLSALTCLRMLNPRRAAFLATDLVKGVERFGNALSSLFGILKDALQLLRLLSKERKKKENGVFLIVKYSQ